MYDERFCRMWEFYLISAEMMFRTGSQLVFHMQLARKRDAAPIVRDYVVEAQERYRPDRGRARRRSGPVGLSDRHQRIRPAATSWSTEAKRSEFASVNVPPSSDSLCSRRA